ncbi:MAG: hypothetical protein PUG38_01755 [Sutterellaceae bacterium]|nr:hypothetical protein [Sutterellaceae bacterium]
MSRVVDSAKGGEPSGNKVTLEGGNYIGGFVTGFSSSGNAERNETVINNATIKGLAASAQTLKAGNTNENKLTVNNISASEASVFAGWAYYGGDAKDNVLQFNSGTVGRTVAAGQAESGEASGNKITIAGGTAGIQAFGGYGAKTASGNRLEISGDAVVGLPDGNVNYQVAAAGRSTAGDASGNEAVMTGGTVYGSIQGGSGMGKGFVSGNTLTLSGGEVTFCAEAGYAQRGTATGNNTTMTGGVVGEVLTGGMAQLLSEGNTTLFTGGEVKGRATGGEDLASSTATTTVKNNTLTMSGSAKTASAFGGLTVGVAEGNKAIIEGGEAGQVFGGHGKNGATGNSVEVSGSASVTKSVYGGFSALAGANGNTVTVKGGTIAKSVVGGQGTSAAEGNTVEVTADAKVSGGAYGGYVAKSSLKEELAEGETGAATGNKVTVTGTSVGGTWGGYSTLGAAEGNTVTLTGATVTGDAAGGTGLLSANSNTVVIDGSNISGNVYGGAATGEGGKAEKNTVTLSNSPTIGGTVWGGYNDALKDAAGQKALTNASGNSLTVVGSNATAGNIAGFDSITFEMPEGTKSGDTMLHLTAAEDTYITGSSVSAKANGGLELKPGDKVYLIKKDSGNLDSTGFAGSTSGVTVAKGSTATLSGVMHQDDNDLVLEVVEEKLKPGTKTIAESRLAMASLVNIATDLFVDETYHQIARDSRKDGGLVPFVTVRGSNMRYSTGSHIDVDGFEMNAGLGLNKPNRWGRATAGAYFEYGRGHYTTVAEGIKAKGDSHYTGVALFAREDFEKGAYLEGTFRGGQVKGDYNSRVLGAHFDSKSRYFAGELGAGFIFNFSEVSKLDTYAKFLWSRIAKDEVKLSTGELYELDRVKSDRGRLGFRYDRVLNEKSTLYFGAAYQYEFAGEARAYYDGMSTAVPSLGGSSGFFELGATLKPNAASPWEFRIGATAWVGVNKGFTGHAVADYRF